MFVQLANFAFFIQKSVFFVANHSNSNIGSMYNLHKREMKIKYNV
jgi:hypothetical protein